MTELIAKMTFWLLAAIVLGFIFGWILSRIKKTEKYEIEIESLNGMLSERETKIKELTNDYEKSTELLTQKMNLIESFEEEKSLREEQDNCPENEQLIHEVQALRKVDQERKLELNEFEKVVLKAEQRLESHQSSVEKLEQKIELLKLENDEKIQAIELYKETIVEFENELKLYKASKDDVEFVISKDQFLQIEEQLVEYQKEIELLKRKNSALSEPTALESAKVEKHDTETIDNGTVAKIFKDTYKKITKS